MNPLNGWQNFYVIVGSSAGALIGLQFVVMTLISELPAMRDGEQASAAFATPTIVHFGAVLLLAAIQCAPWDNVSNTEIAWTLMGVSGIIYQYLVVRRMRAQTAYRPVFEDTLFHVVLPFAAYIALAATAFLVRWDVKMTLFFVAGTALVLLFVGIHNAWDAVTYHVFSLKKKLQDAKTKTP